MGERFYVLTYEDRIKIELLNKQKKSMREIARQLEKSPSTISRELHANDPWDNLPYRHFIQYDAQTAQYRAQDKRLATGNKGIHFTACKERQIKEKMEEGWSPAQIVHTILHDAISVSTFYNMIHQHRFKTIRGDQHLIRQDKRWNRAVLHSLASKREQQHYKQVSANKKSKQQAIKQLRQQENVYHHISIDQRPKCINLRHQFGHFEMDCVESKKNSYAVLTICERKTRMFFAFKIENKRSQTIVKTLDLFLKDYKDVVKSITTDNGHEFINRPLDQYLTQQRVKHYVAHPYASYERGTNENLNGVLRRHFPKGTDFKLITQQDLDAACRAINGRPVRLFEYKRSSLRAFTTALNKSRSHRRLSTRNVEKVV